jgi:hypothetical protein
MFHTDPRGTGPVESLQQAAGRKVSASGSTSYDYTGADIAQKRADELSSVAAAKQAALYSGDIQGALSTGRRIADLKEYLDAYHSGSPYSGVFGSVVPGVRVASSSGSSSVDNDLRESASYHNPLHNQPSRSA